MDINTILDLTWIPLLVFAISSGFGVVLVTTKNPGLLLNSKNPQLLKDRKQYAVGAGKLLLLVSCISLLNCILLFVNAYIALAEAVGGFVLFGILWKQMTDQYGPC